MNMLKTIAVALCALSLTACASPDYEQYSKAQVNIATAKHQADAVKYKALSDIASSGDSSAKIAAVMALAVGTGDTQQSIIQAPQPNQALQWASILVPGITQVAGMRYNYLSQQTQSNNATALGMSTNNTFVGLAGKIQAPGSTSTYTSTTTLSGTGNLGSGTYSTTDRNDSTSSAPIVVTPVTVVPPVVVNQNPAVP